MLILVLNWSKTKNPLRSQEDFFLRKCLVVNIIIHILWVMWKTYHE